MLSPLLVLVGCPDGYNACLDGGEEVSDDAIECGTGVEGPFNDLCKQAVFLDALGSPYAITSHSSCSSIMDLVAQQPGLVVFDWTMDPEDCGSIPQAEQWPCFTELELYVNGASPDIKCGYCSKLTTGAPPYGCWAHPSRWEDGKLQGHLLQEGEFCDDIEPPIGEVEGYTLPFDCPEGSDFSCLGGVDRCSCTCRSGQGLDVGYGPDSASGYFAHWWSPVLLPDVPPLVEGVGYPEEATCSGEPLVWVASGGGGSWLGSTVEFNGSEPNDPPNGELWHTLLKDIVGPTSTPDGATVTAEFAEQALLFPSELLLGSHGDLVLSGGRPAWSIDACDPGSYCDVLGLAIGDVIVGVSVDGPRVELAVLDQAGGHRDVVVEVVQ